MNKGGPGGASSPEHASATGARSAPAGDADGSTPSHPASPSETLTKAYLDHVLRTVEELREEVEIQRAAKEHAVNLALERAAVLAETAHDLMSNQDIADGIRKLKGGT